MLFFVEGKIEKAYYGLETASKYFEHRTIVEAESEYEAEQKYHAYWENKCDQYNTNYVVVRTTINEGIR